MKKSGVKMTSCDMCGKKIEKGIKAKIEGTEMSVCSDCSKYGEIIGGNTHNNFNNSNKSFNNTFKKKVIRDEIEEDIVSGYGLIVKNAREKMNLKQDELAKKINEKISLIHQIESEHLKPRLVTAKKLEKFFGIKLIHTISNTNYSIQNKNEEEREGEELTFGDLIKKAMKKKK